MYGSSSGLLKEFVTMHSLTLGLDFGSSTTKVVIRDNVRAEFPWVVPFEDDSYMLETRLFLDHDVFNVLAEGKEILNIKKAIVNNDDNCIEYVTAYLTFVFRRTLHWFFYAEEETSNIYGRIEQDPHSIRFYNCECPLKSQFVKLADIEWTIHVGMPNERTAWDSLLEERLRLAARSAWILACLNVPVKYEYVKRVLQETTKDPHWSFDSFYVKAFPEIVAQLKEYISESSGHEGIVCVIDIGALTLDIAVLNIVRNSKRQVEYKVYHSSVTMNSGVYYFLETLHGLDRTDDFYNWLNQNCSNRITLPPTFLSIEPTKRLLKKLKNILAKTIKDLKRVDPNYTNHWNNGLVTYLLGGGAFYNAFTMGVRTQYPEIQRQGVSGFNISQKPFSNKPLYQRLGVAYGLSLEEMSNNNIQYFDEPPSILDEFSSNGANFLSSYDKDAG